MNSLDALSRVPFLRTLDSDQLAVLAAELPIERFGPERTIFRRGERPEALYILLEGEVELLQPAPDGGEESVGMLRPPDILGAEELIVRQPRQSSARVTEPTTVLRWERVALRAFMKQHPKALSSLRFLADGQRMARSMDIPWLRDGEMVYALTRRHPFILYQRLSLPTFMLAGALLLILWGYLSQGSLILWAGIGLGLASGLLALWQWIDWRNDAFIVTDRRCVWLEKVLGLYDSRREAPLHTVLSVSMSTDMSGRMFGFGNVIIRTYTGKVIFREIPEPETVTAIIEENWRRLKAQQEAADREALIQALQRRLDEEQEAGGGEASSQEALAATPETTSGRAGLDRWGFKVRFEDRGVITYRKHWAVLLQAIALPTGCLIAMILLLGLHLAGVLNWLPATSASLAFGGAALGAALWWAYRYVDWANDIYQITDEQIIDVYKKPLGREQRKVAPLENILGTEVDRKGLLGILLNYGNVVANVGTEQFTFEGVFDPVMVQQDIVHAQETLMQRRAEGERAKRQEEMVELFDIYHDQFSRKQIDGENEGPLSDGHS